MRRSTQGRRAAYAEAGATVGAADAVPPDPAAAKPTSQEVQEVLDSFPGLAKSRREWVRRNIVEPFWSCWDKSLPPARGTTCYIPHSKVVKVPPRPELDSEKVRAFKEIVDSMIKRDIVEPSRSPYNSPAFLVPKRVSGPGPWKVNDQWRLVVDLSKLNQCVLEDNYYPPQVETILDAMAGNEFYSSLDQVQKSRWPRRADRLPLSTCLALVRRTSSSACLWG